ncbi:unnamed protein product [Vitrella brassicaformis CCMP3155]|uniref:Fatty acid hydroxylase domain-containing protein n=1 Tax=Vitrella brassicaformis (strain CCMP3155) TaxID=1169540 RepID=A0A0G4ENL0_VITBC|nr:unnamed protein product [Vitrella brassicaformis CCMP3155]|mmetsp:Transcript_14786/g.35258  ORF Transcript_14786/g.35258 Transcript_14786/m.35258 type:complete len:308 (-) Transcript_14786:517-1440(-)|eukprot:CEL99449.1 unnamed protein product [Vitrella brassicaformis CCMP3155]
MVLCEVSEGLSFPLIWGICTVLGAMAVMSLSSVVFCWLYWRPTYEQWRHKSNPAYPSPGKVREEIIQCLKGMVMAVLCPAITIWLSSRGLAKGFCGAQQYSWGFQVLVQVVFWLFVDFTEFYYHRATHVYKFLWRFHKHHHTFFNPSPFAVIADEMLDQFVRASPMLLFPLFVPINIDLMFLQMGIFSYGYGVYLHSGHELKWPDAHHPWINTAFQHYCHHAMSIYNKPYHCGFFLKVFDRMWGCMYTGKCLCVKCATERGERSYEKWEAVEKPDYSVLLSVPFWCEGLALEWKQIRRLGAALLLLK